MEKFSHLAILCLCCLLSSQASAVKIMLCANENGEKIYMDNCPPGYQIVQERKYYIEKKTEPEVPSVIMYLVPDAPWIQEIRNYFSKYEIPIVEKDVSESVELQQELMESSGELIVPTVKLNEEIYKGYLPSEMDMEMEKSGYTLWQE